MRALVIFYFLGCSSLFAQIDLQMQLECGKEKVEEKFGNSLNGSKGLEAMGFPSKISDWIDLNIESPYLQQMNALHQSLVEDIAGGVDRQKLGDSENAGIEADKDSPTGFKITDLYRVTLKDYGSEQGKAAYRQILEQICSQISSRHGFDITDRCVETSLQKHAEIDRFLEQHGNTATEFGGKIVSQKFPESQVWKDFHEQDYNACAITGNGNAKDHRFARDDVLNTAICWGLPYFLSADEMVLGATLYDQKGNPAVRIVNMSVGGKLQAYYAPFIGNGVVLNPAFANVYGGDADSWNAKILSYTGPLQARY